MAEIAGVVVSPVLTVAEWLAAPIWSPLKYLYNYGTNFKNLEKEVKKMESTRDEVQRKITAAENNVEEIKQEVKDWKTDVEETITKAKQLIEEKANTPRCFKGLCPNFIARYKESKKAFKLKRDVIDPLIQQETEFHVISVPTNPPEIWLRSSEDYLAFESRNSTVNNVWDALKDETVDKIGVFGMGGLGKTTLVQEVGRNAAKEKLFEEIVFVEVGKSPDTKKIQTIIAEKLGLTFKNESEMAKKLYERMKGKNILLILDNIWEDLHLTEAFGVPSGVDRGRNKLLLTTRDERVLRKMGCTKNFGMGFLNQEEAWILFAKMAGNVVQTRELQPLPNEVCNECRGLPIVICTIAKALTRETCLSEWKVALQELRAPSPPKLMRFLEEEYTKIALSYKYLRNDELKETFLISSLLENDTSISDLFKHVVCLDILKGANMTMEDKRNLLDKLVRDLKAACLLLDGFDSGQFAMHDVIRAVATTIAHVDHHVFTTRNDIEGDWKNRDELKKCTKISLPGDSTIISQLWPNDLDCPNLEYFSMTNMWESSFEIPEDLFKVMPKLRVLNLDRLRQSPLPSSIDLLTNLQTLCLDSCKIEDVAVIGKLRKLKVLSLQRAGIEELPMEMGRLIELRLLDLTDCWTLKVIAPNVISKLSKLEELYMKGCNVEWEIELLKELKLLSGLTSLELDIEDNKALTRDFFFKELKRYQISIGAELEYVPRIDWEHEILRKLEFNFNSTIYLEELGEINNVEVLILARYLDEEDDHEHSQSSVHSNESTSVFNKKVIFSDLKVLTLADIISRKIWDSQLPTPSFQNLKELTLQRCTKIKYVFPLSIARSLQQLQHIRIWDCEVLEGIVDVEEGTEPAVSFLFPQVTKLELVDLPELTDFYPGMYYSEWPKLKLLMVQDCPKFKVFTSEPKSLCLDQKINHDLDWFQLEDIGGRFDGTITWGSKHLEFSNHKSVDIPLGMVLQRFENLTVLGFTYCHRFLNLIKPSTARSLAQLREMKIWDCRMLIEILENEGDATTEIVFEKLNKLILYDLKSLVCFCSGSYTFNFPSLEELKIIECPDMKTFCGGILTIPKLKKINYKRKEVEIEENNLNRTLQSQVYAQDDLTKAVVRTLNQGSNVMSMDFHPQQQTILLVGTNVGDISLWEVGSRERLVHKSFKVWDISAASMPLQTALLNDAAISVNRCVWGPDGLMLGVAFSKHIVQIYTYNPTGELRQHLEIDAHVGGVNDIAFAHPNKQLCIVTCGDDKTIKVWDAGAGCRLYIFEGHEAPVYSVCPHHRENIQFIFSTAIDGKIKAWLYDCLGSRVDYDAPGHWCTMMAYSADGTRLFSCGTSKEGESHLVEWHESEGAIKRTYSGFRKRSLGVVQFDTTRNWFLAAGDEFQIKFWDMDNTNMLTAVDADGGLPASPRLRFNKEGSLLAVTTSDNGIKILANSDGLRLIRMLESRAIDKNRVPSEPINSKPLIVNALGPAGNVSGAIAPTLERPDRVPPAVSINSLGTMDSSRLVDVKPRIVDDGDKVKSWKIPDVSDPSQMKALRLPDSIAPSKVVRLIYTNSGLALLALTSSAVHKLWKWQRSERNPLGKATAYVSPQLWQPPSGTLMTNDISDGKPAEESAACIALSKNDSYVMSASGGKVSLFNMMTFKVMTMFMPPPPAATFLAFHPQDNNIIAIGMEDSTIQIYNVRVDEVKTKLKGHQNRITGLAFSQTLNALVSSGADAQLCMWSIDKWEKLKSRFIQAPAGRQSPLVGETKVQFHNDQAHLLVVHDSQISIYDSKLECSRTWSPKDALPASISSAIYSCDGLLVYAGFCDGAVGVFDADNLRLRCRIAPSAYIPSFTGNTTAYPFVIAAHPSEPNQIALGMSDGSVHVVEPSDTELKWGGTSSQDNGSLPSNSSNPSLTGQPSELPPR